MARLSVSGQDRLAEELGPHPRRPAGTEGQKSGSRGDSSQGHDRAEEGGEPQGRKCDCEEELIVRSTSWPCLTCPTGAVRPSCGSTSPSATSRDRCRRWQINAAAGAVHDRAGRHHPALHGGQIPFYYVRNEQLVRAEVWGLSSSYQTWALRYLALGSSWVSAHSRTRFSAASPSHSRSRSANGKSWKCGTDTGGSAFVETLSSHATRTVVADTLDRVDPPPPPGRGPGKSPRFAPDGGTWGHVTLTAHRHADKGGCVANRRSDRKR